MQKTLESFPKYHFLGIEVAPLTKDDLLAVINSAVDANEVNCIIGNHNLHSLYLQQHDEQMRLFYNRARYVHVDGMSLIYLARLLGLPLNGVHRTAYLDWFDDFLHIAMRNAWRLYFLGGTPELASVIPVFLTSRYASLQIRTHHGYNAFENRESIFAEIEEYHPHVAIIGMGMPLQEKWILQALERIQVHVLLPCGGTMDYYIGVQDAAPRWIGSVGLEWLYRLVKSPSRLHHRYLVEPWSLMPMIFKELLEKTSHAHKYRKDLHPESAPGQRSHSDSQTV